MKYDIHIRIGKDEMSFGKGVVMLLENIERFDSLSAAYKEMGMSSSKAWKILNRAQNDLGFPLLESTTGGKNGGATHLTQQGKEFLMTYKHFCERIEFVAQEEFEKAFGKKW